MYIGNDIVDISYENSSEHSRFARRVLAYSEHSLYEKHPTPFLYLWRAWASKEAAYKLVKQIFHNARFIPKNYVYNEHQSIVTYENFDIPLVFKCCQNFIYCYGFLGVSNLYSEIAPIDSLIGKDVSLEEIFSQGERSLIQSADSLAARVLVKQYLKSRLGFHCRNITIWKDANGAPKVSYLGRRLTIPLSLTHHGRYVAILVGLPENINWMNH